MLNINNFFNNFKSAKFQNNLKKTKNIFLSLKNELENYEIPIPFSSLIAESSNGFAIFFKFFGCSQLEN